MNFLKIIFKKEKLLFFLIAVLFLIFFLHSEEGFFLEKNFKEENDLEKEDVSVNKENDSNQEDLSKEIKVVDGLIVVHNLNKDLIEEKIDQGKEYLLRMINEEENGAHKYYYTLEDSFEERLHTIYTSSLLYTLLNIYNKEKDPALLDQIISSGEFILSMQNKKEGKAYGAFFYSYYLPSSREETRGLDEKGREKKFVVGTTSKTIFTLIRLYDLTGENKYLESAKLGADWLITMQKSDGSMKPYLRHKDDTWYSGKKESLLYNGQVLSALSKIYLATEEEKYFRSAEKIAKRFAGKYEEAGRNFIIGDYRSENPISNSWVAMSFIDFYKASKDEYYRKIIFEMMDLILREQKDDSSSIMDYGQFRGAYSSSGNGWIAEVFSEVYDLCREERMENCEKYKETLLKSIRWNIQHTYIKENSSSLENPERANGGIFWNKTKKYVRTDSVCHGLNAYIGIVKYLSKGTILSI